jgi:hypothetical protein
VQLSVIIQFDNRCIAKQKDEEENKERESEIEEKRN